MQHCKNDYLHKSVKVWHFASGHKMPCQPFILNPDVTFSIAVRIYSITKSICTMAALGWGNRRHSSCVRRRGGGHYCATPIHWTTLPFSKIMWPGWKYWKLGHKFNIFNPLSLNTWIIWRHACHYTLVKRIIHEMSRTEDQPIVKLVNISNILTGWNIYEIFFIKFD